MRRTAFAQAVVLTLLFTSSAVAQEHRRLSGTVLDQDEAPIPGAHVHVTSPELRSFETESKTDKKGAFSALVVNRLILQLEVEIEAEGFQSSKTTFGLPWGGNNTTQRKFRLTSQKIIDEAERKQRAAEAARDSSTAHNAAVELAKAGDWAGAAAKFEEALAVQEDQAVTHAGLATAAWNLKDYARAETHSRRALALDPAAPEMKELLAEALRNQGKNTEADVILSEVAEGNPKLKAELAFNHGADLYNSGKHAEAIASFEEALAADPELVDAHYALAMAALALGDKASNAKALEHLNTFLATVTEGTKAATARSIIEALSKG